MLAEPEKKNENMLAERGFDPRTDGLSTYTPSKARSNCFGKTLPELLFCVLSGLYTIKVVVAEWLRRWT